MERRELLKFISAATGVAFIAGDTLLTGCNTAADTSLTFSEADIALLDEVGEVIIPTTTTPGAKAAEIGKFMKTMVTDCFTAKQRQAFIEGIPQMRTACNTINKKDFSLCTNDEKKAFILGLEKEAKDFNIKNDEANKLAGDEANKAGTAFEPEPPHYYTQIKQLTLYGYFTSEIGCTKQLRDVPIPGRYDGAFPYKKGDRAFSE
jgi:hypothetical protein